ncbi:MAG: hypothetical protein DDT32_00441 [Syntrophomonadaceae bacterium]|nr:hypothetical protein [Bacillota bacterium]
MKLIATLVYMSYIYAGAWALVFSGILLPEQVNIAVLSTGVVLVLLSILPPVRFLHSRLALFGLAGFAGFKRPDPAAKEELLSIWQQAVKFCGHDPAKFRVVVYPSAPHAWPHVTDNVLLLPDGFRQWARTREGQAVLVHEIGHLTSGGWHTFSWLFYSGYRLALLPIQLLRFVWIIAAHMPLINLIAIPIIFVVNGIDTVLSACCTYAQRQVAWASEYRADRFAIEQGFGHSMALALVQYGSGDDRHGSFTHPPGVERIRRLKGQS